MGRNEQKRRRRWEREGYGRDPKCYLCDAAPATTDDHDPPECFSSSPGPATAYRLPACSSCNRQLVRDEVYVRDVLVSSGDNEEASRLVKRTFSGLQGSSPLYPYKNDQQLYRNLKLRDVHSPGGIFLGQLPSYDANTNRINPVVIKIVKGLHFHDLKKSVPSDAAFDVHLWGVPDVDMLSDWLLGMRNVPMLAKGRFPKSVSNDFDSRSPEIMTYLAWQFEDDTASSLWFLSFYRATQLTISVESPRFVAMREAYLDGLIIKPPEDDRT